MTSIHHWSDEKKKEYFHSLEQIQILDFVLVELTLYLDTHPNDRQAIRQYNETTRQSFELKNRFQQRFGPLQPFGGSYSTDPWSWGEAPWPWQI
ncbi:spore coat protein CotJB [Salinithrix halophila]|uniref:Spore coat protein CotJB n=1 Tax=Salinithrix halophila TaxID=1485204 RepID=A0ABV8JD07_9BACL